MSPQDWMSLAVQTALAILTGAYVVVTYRLLRATRHASDRNAEAFMKQFQLAAFPALNIAMSRGNGDVVDLTISNTGTTPAFDVFAFAVGLYNEEEIALDQFIETFGKSKQFDRRTFEAGDDGFFGVYETLAYASLPSRRAVVASLTFPMPIKQASVHMQWRDVQGLNYGQTYWLFRHEDDSERYAVGSLEPAVPLPGPRYENGFGHARDSEGGVGQAPGAGRSGVRGGLSACDSGELPT